ncbi:hypothetical protein MHBO_001358 [Bonamia ostreae]|uniref:Uncharacterized protein n=1 Tax=Bonamia ostreae TaxID=126728 RepID=A0ABV2AIP5_9EUKA
MEETELKYIKNSNDDKNFKNLSREEKCVKILKEMKSELVKLKDGRTKKVEDGYKTLKFAKKLMKKFKKEIKRCVDDYTKFVFCIDFLKHVAKKNLKYSFCVLNCEDGNSILMTFDASSDIYCFEEDLSVIDSDPLDGLHDMILKLSETFDSFLFGEILNKLMCCVDYFIEVAQKSGFKENKNQNDHCDVKCGYTNEWMFCEMTGNDRYHIFY